ncbi:hypothetical protein LIER_16620 [Lithospermum erythrorhizon]|uniref:Uncharacterized protein n=1 Tax=Lithospermum erythrorhizon TaxID=34254 RepID=A0AAV3Q990_LITER
MMLLPSARTGGRKIDVLRRLVKDVTTLGKKKAGETGDDACRVVEPAVVEDGAQNMKGNLKTKGKWSKAPVSTKRSRNEPIRSIAPIDTAQEVTQDAAPQIHNFEHIRRVVAEKMFSEVTKRMPTS